MSRRRAPEPTAATARDLRNALRSIINVLGPRDYTCPNCCEGCNIEMSEALHIAKEVLRRAPIPVANRPYE